ncbi:MAG: DNA mismatch repair endonuclease MutL [Clostridia bacterium]|nr:DNA mismatch repair endonuclease MutL [Clostridia bacterium]
MGKIVLLDELTINQIAAGEVIERPASVIKEMVENSIDAGAKNITVEIKKGGIDLIKITDDGCGIAEDDMEIAFERHATSKIRNADDLATVKSMGFRGEALASIGAIARVEMISRTEGEEFGHKIVVEGGEIKEKTEVGCQKGTTITVENLFYNTPVRYKFLKKDYTEAGYIEDAITRIALVNKGVAIKLINSGKVVVQTNGNNDQKTVIYSVYGKDIANGILDVDYTYEDMKITGVVGKPEIARGNRSYQLFFINGRFVKDKNLSAAADQAYKGMIPIGKFGFIVLNIEMDPQKLDVNVHPAKLEVRFQDEGQIFKAVYHAIKSGLSKGELIANSERPAIIAENKSNSKIEDNIKEDKIEEKSTEYSKIIPETDIVQPKIRNGFTELLKKVIKEPEEKREEYNNNLLESIFEERNGNKRITPQVENNIEISKPSIDEEVKIEKSSNTSIDEVIQGKSIKFGNVSISSDTAELDVNINDIIKSEKKEEYIYEDDDSEVSKQDVSKESVDESNDKITKEDISIKTNDTKSNELNNITNSIVKSKIENSFEPTQVIDTKKVRENLNEAVPKEATPEFAEMYKKTFGKDIIKKPLKENDNLNSYNEFLYSSDEGNFNVFEDENTYIAEKKYKFIGIVFNTYIIIEIDDEMYILDQHAAHERIMYEKVRANYYSEVQKDSQMLLLPDIITLTHKEWLIAKENVAMFEKAGFGFEEFGENTLKLFAVPSICEKLNTKQLFLDVLDEIDSVAITAKQEKEDKFIATIACKSAVKAKMKLDIREVNYLMDDLLKLPNPFTCPHGRPTAIKMTKVDFEKKFNRR